jgi:23S rRNA (uridine2552-2'-O)-methyltransferase
MANKSSRSWLREHFTDPFVKQAQKEGYRSRAVYKLLEIQQRDHLFKPGMIVVDLGAAPGGWSQLVVKLVKPKGRVIALDILPMEPIDDVDFILGDFSDDAVLQSLCEQLPNGKVDWVLSDMSPNMSGHESVDIPRSMYLSELALDFAIKMLNPEGGFFIKVFQGAGFDAFFATLKRNFKSVATRKPKASRGRSREIYILARGLKLIGA